MMPSPMPFMFGPGTGGMTMPFLPGPRMLPGMPYGGMPSYGQSPNRMMSPYSPAGNGGSGYGAGGYGGGGTDNAFGTGMSAYTPAMPTVASSTWLDALSLPNEGGKLAWPLGLRVLAPASEMDPLRQRVDTLLPMLAAQAGQGAGNAAMSEELQRTLRQMRRLLTENGDGLAEATQTEARRFLTTVGRAVKKLY